MQPLIITFAGVVGSSKTPIASYLSWNLNLPVFNNDAIRSEVQEDLLRSDLDEHRKRRDLRLHDIIQRKISFICDASIDREWANLRPTLEKAGYTWCIISLDLSKELLEKLYTAKGYDESLKRLDELIEQHLNFLKTFSTDCAVHITDTTFPNRLQVSLETVQRKLQQL